MKNCIKRRNFAIYNFSRDGGFVSSLCTNFGKDAQGKVAKEDVDKKNGLINYSSRMSKAALSQPLNSNVKHHPI